MNDEKNRNQSKTNIKNLTELLENSTKNRRKIQIIMTILFIIIIIPCAIFLDDIAQKMFGEHLTPDRGRLNRLVIPLMGMILIFFPYSIYAHNQSNKIIQNIKREDLDDEDINYMRDLLQRRYRWAVNVDLYLSRLSNKKYKNQQKRQKCLSP